jgi:molybdate transport system permease protein
LENPLVWPALRLSAMTTMLSLFITVALGTPLAWLLAGSRTRGMRAIEVTLQLPVVIPPAVAGVALLLAFGRRGALAFLYPAGWSIPFTTTAVVMAEVFVSAPFFIQAAVNAFRELDNGMLLVAQTFGASSFRIFARIALPLAAPGLISGATMSWARALGEFGATLMFAGNMQGRTQTLPLAIYVSLESDLRAAQALSIVLMGVALCVLVLARITLRRHTTNNGGGNG